MPYPTSGVIVIRVSIIISLPKRKVKEGDRETGSNKGIL